jgi:hypothetical protein
MAIVYKELNENKESWKFIKKLHDSVGRRRLYFKASLRLHDESIACSLVTVFLLSIGGVAFEKRQWQTG